MKQACVKSKNSPAAAFYKEVKMKKIKTIEATEAVVKAMSDPEARLRAMFEAKMRGDM